MFKFYSNYVNGLLEVGRLSGASKVASLHFMGPHRSFFPAISHFLLFINPCGRELSFKHLYVPQTRRWLIQKYLRRGASRDMEVWVSTARGLFWIGWTIMRLQWFAVTEQMHSLLICHRDMQMQGRTGTGDYYQCLKICGDSTFSSGSYMQLFHVSRSNNLVVWFPHHCISSVFSLSLVAAKRWLVKVTCKRPITAIGRSRAGI